MLAAHLAREAIEIWTRCGQPCAAANPAIALQVAIHASRRPGRWVVDMEPLALYIRLFIATVAAVGSSIFVAVYTPITMDAVRMRLAMPLESFPKATLSLANCGWYSLFVPACLLVLGMFVMHRWKSKAAFEFVVGCQWLFAFLWLTYCLFACLLPEILTSGPLKGRP